MDHDWHLFDQGRGYEVRREGDEWWVRRRHEDADVIEEVVYCLAKAEFDQLRSEGPNPRELN